MGWVTRKATFRKHKIRRTGHFKCACGKSYTRVKSSGWTENPFHQWQGRESQLDAEKRREADGMLRASLCPICHAPNDPAIIT